jgi:hypothetical protein
MLDAAGAAVRRAVGPSGVVIANGLGLYPDNPPDHGLSLLPHVDGLMVEHFMAFESLDPVNGTLVPAMFAEAVALLATAAADNKTVLVRAWPGPATLPIGALGPSWPGGRQPTTYAGLAGAAAAWLTPALAAYLIVATPTTWFSYTWWYTAPDGVYPCPAGECSAPAGWYPDLARPLGAPTSPAGTRVPGGTGWAYSRTFEHATVWFDAGNVSGATITWS